MKLSFEQNTVLLLFLRLFLRKYVVIFRGIRYISNVANFELTELDNMFKCLRELID